MFVIEILLNKFVFFFFLRQFFFSLFDRGSSFNKFRSILPWLIIINSYFLTEALLISILSGMERTIQRVLDYRCWSKRLWLRSNRLWFCCHWLFSRRVFLNLRFFLLPRSKLSKGIWFLFGNKHFLNGFLMRRNKRRIGFLFLFRFGRSHGSLTETVGTTIPILFIQGVGRLFFLKCRFFLLFGL